jgi:arginine exporter protein ArgO
LINFLGYFQIGICLRKSYYFTVTNGVKQGAVLSPILFCIYIDNLLKLLADTGVGCYIGPHFVGELAYAGDIVLLAPTASAMRSLLAVCDEYSREYCISFNVSNTKCLVVTPRSRHATFDRVRDCIFFFFFFFYK